MSKIKRVFAILICAMLLIAVTTGLGVTVYAAEEVQSTEQGAEMPGEAEINTEKPETTESEETDGSTIDSVAAKFIGYLKAKYGDDYEYYYNLIIEQWGSIEGYLLAFGSKLPDEYQSGWDKFVGWLKEYAPLWATPLAIAIVIIVAFIGKKAVNGAIERIVNKKLNPVVEELNRQSKAQIATVKSQKALLGGNVKFAQEIQELDEAAKELTNG